MQAATGDLFEMSAPEPKTITAIITKVEQAVLPPDTKGFDYSVLPPDVETVARGIAKRIVESQELHLAMAVEAGRGLAAVKDKLGHGNWLPWLEQECRIDQRTAQRYMAAAEAFGEKCDTVSYLPMGTVYKLAAPKAEPVRAQIIAEVAAGQRPTPKDIDNRLWQVKQIAKANGKADTAARQRARERKQIQVDIDWIDQRDAERERDVERAAVAARLADILMSKLDRAELASFRETWGSNPPPLERALTEWVNPERRAEREHNWSKEASERRERRAKLASRLERKAG